MRGDELLLPWYECLLDRLPGLSSFDIHTHVGANDPSGFHLTTKELIAALETVSGRAATFPLEEPDGYRDANQRVLAEAAASDGRLVAFCRLDANAEPLAEARRCVEGGARGIKLHPRAEAFELDHPALRDVFALASAGGRPVLVHAGGGVGGVGRQVLRLASEFPAVPFVLAHAGLSDLAAIWQDARELPNLFFDTSWWNPDDLLALFALVPPRQILYGSDTPYETPLLNSIVTMRCAFQAGLSGDQVRAVMGAQTERLLAGRPALDLGAVQPPAPDGDSVLLRRVHSNLVAAVAQMRIGERGHEGLMLAGYACQVRPDAAEREVCDSVLSLLDRHRRYVDERGSRSDLPHAPGYPLVVAAAAVARTPDVPLPGGGFARPMAR